MIGTVPNPINTAILTAGELTELVRGQEQSFLAQFTPPSAGTVVSPFAEQHWPAMQMMLAGEPVSA